MKTAGGTAVILGSEGQDGRLLYDYLKKAGQRVIGIGREGVRSTDAGFTRAPVDLGSERELEALIHDLRPDEVYHLAAVHHSAEEEASAQATDLFRRSHAVNFLSIVYLLEAIRRYSPRTRVFYAASSHVFGDPPADVQDESTPLQPDSVYGLTKASGLLACRMHRHAHGTYAAAGILYNHESPLRAPQFLSQKIVRAAHEIRAGARQQLMLGNLGAVIDWGYAPDYVRAMRAVMQLGHGDEYILATGVRHTVADFARVAFEIVGLDWTRYVVEDRSISLRKSPVRIGNPTKLMQATGWKPEVGFEEMVRKLVEGFPGS